MNNTFLRNISKVSLITICLLSANTSFAQSLKITPTSRLLVDAATFSDKNVELTDGVAIRDFRMGLKATYDQFFFKADASYANNKVSLKDIYLQYNLSEKALVRAGHFTVPFGLSSAYGTAHKQFMAEPSSNVYQMGRRVGIMHSLWNDQLWLSYGAFADVKSISESTDKSGKQGYTIGERFVYRPFSADGQLLQAGFSMNHTQAEATGKGNPRVFNYNTTYLTVVDKTKAVDAVIDQARYENKYTVELAGIYKNFALESQYYWSNIKRKDSPSFNSDGFYVTAKGILLNKADYKYNKQTAGINSPANKALELAVGYSMLNMNSSKTGIYGGKMDDISVGLAFYWNKYVTVRTNYSYITVKTKDEDPKKRVNAFQCRVQYYF
jgi:phosphate-selective porin OprO/OprP